MLHVRGVELAPKPFSIGVRIEHLQAEIDRAQYRQAAGQPASRRRRVQARGPRRRRTLGLHLLHVPGGEVVPAASEADGVVTNGMSRFARDGRNANSALLVSVRPEDFGAPDRWRGSTSSGAGSGRRSRSAAGARGAGCSDSRISSPGGPQSVSAPCSLPTGPGTAGRPRALPAGVRGAGPARGDPRARAQTQGLLQRGRTAHGGRDAQLVAGARAAR